MPLSLPPDGFELLPCARRSRIGRRAVGAACAAAVAACAAVASGSARAEPLPAPAADSRGADPLTRDVLLQFLRERGSDAAGSVQRTVGAVGQQVVAVQSMASNVASNLVLAALNFIDLPYVFGGNSAQTGFDCSGFTRHVFRQAAGLALPRRAEDQAGASNLTPVERADLRPGDLVFFNTLRRTFSHVGIYIGEGRFIHAPRTGADIRIDNLKSTYWDTRFTGARRAAMIDGAGPERAH